jgi:hypothetical protein
VSKTERTSRQIPLSRRFHVIGFQPLATGSAEHESALERDFVTLTSFADSTARIVSQPVTIAFPDGPITRRYTPDLFVRRRAERSELIEVKYQADLRAQGARLAPAFEAAQTWACERHATFRIVTEREIRGPRLKNAQRLLPLRDAPLDREIAELALIAARLLQPPTFGSLLMSWARASPNRFTTRANALSTPARMSSGSTANQAASTRIT